MGQELEQQKPKKVSDKLLRKYARFSAREIEQKTGIPALEAMARIEEMLDEEDWLSDLRKEQLLIDEFQDIAEEIKDRMHSVDDEFFADMANSAIRAMNSIGQRWDAMRKVITIDINDITAAHGRIFGSAFDIALWHVVDILMEENPSIERARVRELVREGMLLADRKLKEYQHG